MKFFIYTRAPHLISYSWLTGKVISSSSWPWRGTSWSCAALSPIPGPSLPCRPPATTRTGTDRSSSPASSSSPAGLTRLEIVHKLLQISSSKNDLTWRRERRFVRSESLLLIHGLAGSSEPFRFAGVSVILRLPHVAPGREARQGRHELGLCQLLVFTDSSVEQLLRVLDHTAHGLLHYLADGPGQHQLSGPTAELTLSAGGAGRNLKVFYFSLMKYFRFISYLDRNIGSEWSSKLLDFLFCWVQCLP